MKIIFLKFNIYSKKYAKNLCWHEIMTINFVNFQSIILLYIYRTNKSNNKIFIYLYCEVYKILNCGQF